MAKNFLWVAFVAVLGFCCNIEGAQVNIVQILPDDSRGKYYQLGYQIAYEELSSTLSAKTWQGEPLTLNWMAPLYYTGSSDNIALLENALAELEKTRDDKNPVFVLGGYGSSRIAEEIIVANKYNVTLVNGGGGDEFMYLPSTNANGSAFGVLSPVSKLAQSTMDYLMKLMDDPSSNMTKPAVVALLWEDADHGEAYRRVVTRYALQYPDYFQMAYAVDFPLRAEGSNPFRQLAHDLHRASLDHAHHGGINVLLVDAHSEDFKNMQQEFWEFPFNFTFVSYGARGVTPDDVQTLIASVNDESVADKLVAAEWWSPSLPETPTEKFLSTWRLYAAYLWAEENRDDVEDLFELPSEQLSISWYGAMGYTAAKTLLEALEKTTDQTESGVRNYLRRTTFADTLLPGGSFRFGETGQVDNLVTLSQGKTESNNKTALGYDATFSTIYVPGSSNNNIETYRPMEWDTSLKACTSDFVGHYPPKHEIAYCKDDGYYHVTFYFKEFAGMNDSDIMCRPLDQPCGCEIQDNQFFKFPKSTMIPCEYIPLNSTNGLVVIIFSMIGALICFTFLVVILVHYNNVVMKAGQREFLAIMAWAGLWCNIGAVSFLGPNTTDMCITRVFSVLFSVTLLVASLTVKVYRIYRLWNNPSMKKISITACDMFKVLAGLLFGMIIIFSVWMGLESQRPHAQETKITVPGRDDIYITVKTCEYYENIALPVISIGYIIFILFYCNVLSFQGRNSDDKYMESRSIMGASYLLTLIVGLVVILVATSSLGGASKMVLMAIGLVFCSVLFVGLVLGPKVYFALKPSFGAVRNAISSRLQSRSQPTREDQTDTGYQEGEEFTSTYSMKPMTSPSPPSPIPGINTPNHAKAAAAAAATVPKKPDPSSSNNEHGLRKKFSSTRSVSADTLHEEDEDEGQEADDELEEDSPNVGISFSVAENDDTIQPPSNDHTTTSLAQI